MEVEVQAALGLRPVPGEAMHHPADFFRTLLLEDLRSIVEGLAGVDDQRQTHSLGGADVTAEALALPVQIALAAVVVQTRLADGHDLGMRCHVHQLVLAGIMALVLIGMHADARRDLGMGLHQGEHLGILLHVDGHAQHVAHAQLAGMIQGLVQAAVEGLEVETVQVAMGIDQIIHGSR